MNDESVAVRGLAIRLVGRLAERNPAYVNPALRKHLLQLLHDMEHSPDNKAREGACGPAQRLARAQPAAAQARPCHLHTCGPRTCGAATLARQSLAPCSPCHSCMLRRAETARAPPTCAVSPTSRPPSCAESAFLLEVLITSAARLIMPYVSPIQKALVGKLRGGGPGLLPAGLVTPLALAGTQAVSQTGEPAPQARLAHLARQPAKPCSASSPVPLALARASVAWSHTAAGPPFLPSQRR
jgi:hypothetical protein